MTGGEQPYICELCGLASTDPGDISTSFASGEPVAWCADALACEARRTDPAWSPPGVQTVEDKAVRLARQVGRVDALLLMAVNAFDRGDPGTARVLVERAVRVIGGDRR